MVLHYQCRMWCWLQPASTESSVNGNIVYGAMFLIGAGGTTLLVTALSFISDMIGKCTVSYGMGQVSGVDHGIFVIMVVVEWCFCVRGNEFCGQAL